MRTPKLFQLMSLLPQHPLEFADRVRILVEARVDRSRGFHQYSTASWKDVIQELGAYVGVNLQIILKESCVTSIEDDVRQRIESLRPEAPFPLEHNADFGLAVLCYALCRAIRPNTVLETGVGYGVTTAFILQALAVNEQGRLHSLDLPPLGRNAARFAGILAPPHLRDRWHYHRGASWRVLPRLVEQSKPIDIFIHDSLHTYRNMCREFETVTPHLRKESVLIADDIQETKHSVNGLSRTLDSSPPYWNPIKRVGLGWGW